jgi:hypothetical protein
MRRLSGSLPAIGGIEVNTERIARGWDLIAEGAAEIALAYRAIDSVGVGGGVPPRSAPAPAATLDDDLPPLLDDYGAPVDAPQAAEKPQNAALGVCPDHRTAWTVKAGGISKNGKPYSAFWKCGEKTDGEYCKQKPTPGWAKAHPIPLDVAA